MREERYAHNPDRDLYMGKAFRLVHHLQGKEPVLRRVVCEVRYQDGQLYLDHCGRLLKGLLGEAPEWILAPDPTPQGTTLYNPRTGTQLGFSVSSASPSLDRTTADEGVEDDEAKEFLEQADAVVGLILGELEITQF